MGNYTLQHPLHGVLRHHHSGLAACCRWVKAAGGAGPVLEAEEQGIEVSPLVSYAGEGLEGICKGQTFNEMLDARLQ